jgi:hypothetical protein
MTTILGAGGAILFDSGKFAREFGFAGTPYADGVRATVAAFQHGAAANE